MMADFFTRLAERSMGLVTQVRPDYPSPLAPAVDVAGLGESFIDSTAAQPAPRAPTELAPLQAAVTATVTPPRVQPRASVTPVGEDETIRPPTLRPGAQDQAHESHFTVDSTVVTTPPVAEGPLHSASRGAAATRVVNGGEKMCQIAAQ